jgi:hypothetical protein
MCGKASESFPDFIYRIKAMRYEKKGTKTGRIVEIYAMNKIRLLHTDWLVLHPEDGNRRLLRNINKPTCPPNYTQRYNNNLSTVACFMLLISDGWLFYRDNMATI